MQSFSAANLSCCECPEKFTSASALLHHFARHALERQGKFGEEGNSRYDWQPWRYDDIFKTKRKGHNFLETALLSINETCRKRAKLLAATTVSTCSENSSYSLTETSEAETKGAENDIIPKTQNLSNTSQHVSSKQHSKYTPKTSKPNHTVQETSTTTNSTEFSNLKLITKNDVTQENQNAAKTKCKFSSKNSLNFTTNNDVTQDNPSTTDIVECWPEKISPSKLKCKKSKRNNIVEENQSLSVEVNNEIPSNYATDGCKEFSLVEENRSFECETGKFSKQPKLSGDRLKPSTVVQEFQGLENNVESIKNCSVKVSSNKLDETNIIPEKRKLPENSECRIQKCRKTSLKISINEGKESKNEKFEDEFLENNVDRVSDGSELVKIIKIEKSLSKDNNCIVEYSGPEPIESPTSNNLELPLVLRTSDTCVNRTNDDCDVVYDNDDDNNFNLDDSVDKVNCDNNNVITYYNDNSQCKLPKIVCGKESREGEECKIVREYSIIEEGKRKLSNRKQTTPKKIERIESEFLKIAPRPENLPRDDRVTPNKKGAKKKYCCPLCSRVFGWSTDLKRHILVHTGERPFKCTHCTSSFTRKFLLQKHQNKMHPLNGKTERERLLELKVSENLKELKSKMLELQKSKESGCKQQLGTQNLGGNNSKQSTETQNLEKSNCQQLLETQNLGNNNSKQLTENQNLEKNNCKQILETENLENNNSRQQSETLKLGENNSDVVHEEVVIKLEPPYETFFKIEHDSDENWDATSNNNNNNDGEIEFPKGCKNENIVFVEPIAVQSS